MMMDSSEIKISGATKRKPALEKAAAQEAIDVEVIETAPDASGQAKNAAEADETSAPQPSAHNQAAVRDYTPRYKKSSRLPAEDRAAAFNPLAWLADGITGVIEEARHNDLGLSQEFWTHLYAVRRESLLAAQALVNSLLAQTESKADKEQESEQRRARRGGVDIDF